jgi:uncharacterized membrane protein (DUF485 family)
LDEGILGTMVTNDPSSTERHDPVYDELHASEDFVELRRRYLRFVIPATVVFLAWYLLYVVMSNWATDFMNQKIYGNINVALVFGLLQFATTFLIAWLYAGYMNRNVDPAARDVEARFNDGRGGGVR